MWVDFVLVQCYCVHTEPPYEGEEEPPFEGRLRMFDPNGPEWVDFHSLLSQVGNDLLTTNTRKLVVCNNKNSN